MDVTIDPHGRLPLPAPLRDRLQGQRREVTWHEHSDGTITLRLAPPTGLFGPSEQKGARTPDPSLPSALLDLVREGGVQTVSPADLIAGPAGVLAARRGDLQVTATFTDQAVELDTTTARAVVDVALAAAAEPAHPSLDIAATGHQDVFTVTAGTATLTFTRDARRRPVWLTVTTH